MYTKTVIMDVQILNFSNEVFKCDKLGITN